uniref:ATP synthase F0 subunit 8 n=1 Tax=Cercopagis pengoi TaxID=141397 RepID=A0A7L7S1K2_9CRUS|nr:ATP synthase F0 subunit 8 [Cercopagis pengoi]
MPQIWPMNWITLFAYFLMCFSLFVVSIHFLNTPEVSTLAKKTSSRPQLHWKW